MIGSFTRIVTRASLGASLLALVSWAPVHADEMTGRQIMDESSRRNDRPIEFTVEEMRLVDASGAEEVRQLRRYAKEFEDGLSKYLLTFDSPSGVAGVAMLTWEKKGDEDDQWTYLPATKKLKRVVGGGKRNYFMGTDFANEDLVAENLDRFRYDRQPDQVIDGVDHYVVNAYPEAAETKKSTGYDHREIYIRKDNFFQDIVKFYERRTKKHKKTLTVTKAVPIDGEGWRTEEAVMDNLKEDHKTYTKILERSFSEDSVPDSIFKHRTIEKNRHMR